MKKSIAQIRSDSTRTCPFSLEINISCKHAGDSVTRMQSIEEVDSADADRYRNSNRRIYREYKTGERCIYADKLIDLGNAVHCDYGEFGEGIHDTALSPSPAYSPTFGPNFNSMYSYPIYNYTDNNQSHQYFGSVFGEYLLTGEVLIQKVAKVDEELLLDIVADSIEFVD